MFNVLQAQQRIILNYAAHVDITAPSVQVTLDT